MEEADQLCERVAIMDHGKILALDSPGRRSSRASAPTPVVTVKTTGDAGQLAELLTRDVEGVDPDPQAGRRGSSCTLQGQ